MVAAVAEDEKKKEAAEEAEAARKAAIVPNAALEKAKEAEAEFDRAQNEAEQKVAVEAEKVEKVEKI